MKHPDAESELEQATIDLFQTLGWHTINAYGKDTLRIVGRETTGEVVLVSHLRQALQRINPDASHDVIQQAIDEITRDRSAMGLVQANHEIYQLLKKGVCVASLDEDGNEYQEQVHVIDWEMPTNNHFLIVSQLSVTGDMYTSRPDIVGFVNGLPLLLIELKAHHKRIENAYEHNLQDYKRTIPHIFWYNAVIVLSNGSQSRIGSITATWEHFVEWKKIHSEGEAGIISLETMIRGTCTPQRLLEITAHFTLFEKVTGGMRKLIAKNHQYLGVNNAIQAVQNMQANQGRIGVFWHTQGSGKSYSMVFFAQKILQTLSGNWTFVVVTDRQELDSQIYKTFACVDAVTEGEEHVRAKSGEHLQQLLGENHRYVFSLIHKFHTEKGTIYPVLSERSDIIVMTDEAHRSQYDTFAQNMRNALPNAAFIGFTGTPLMAGEEKTRQVFGDYVSVYNFKQSIDDGATVPLYYENRIPQLQLTNQDLNKDMERLLDEAALDDAQEQKLEREFAREYHLITRDNRLETIAQDIVEHFLGRGFDGKAMVISIDKLTTVRMYEKVQHHWQAKLESLRQRRATCSEEERERLDTQMTYMQKTDMAVVISQSPHEVMDFEKHGIDIRPHRKRMQAEDLETKFKDPANPLRLVFVCAMWITGFDVPSCSTIYLDKPMRNHTLMQTIARANRVFADKNNGLIVDYVGMFRNLQEALAIYGTGSSDSATAGDMPVKEKQALIALLRDAIEQATTFCATHGVDVATLQTKRGFERVKAIDDAENAILKNDDIKLQYLRLAATVDRLFHAILPDTDANQFSEARAFFHTLSERIRSLTPTADIIDIRDQVTHLLDTSIVTSQYTIPVPMVHGSVEHLVDLSTIDFEKLQQRFANSNHKRTEIAKLRGSIQSKLQKMVRLNRTRINYMDRFQALIEDYNTGASNEEVVFTQLMSLVKELNDEEQRGVSLGLAEDELALFDLLTQPGIALTKEEEEQVKQIAQHLLGVLKREKLVLDWRKKQQAKAGVQMTIEQELDKLPPSYPHEEYEETCKQVYVHIYESYYGSGRSIYTKAAA